VLLVEKTATGVPYGKEIGENQPLDTLFERSAHPGIGVDLIAATLNVTGGVNVPRPKPGLDEGVCAFNSVPAASILVKGRSVRVLVRVHNSTSGVVGRMSATIRALGGTGLIARVRHSAFKGGVEGNRVRGDVVHTLKDVELALVGPIVQAGLPDGRPRSTALWHVPHIKSVDGEG